MAMFLFLSLVGVLVLGSASSQTVDPALLDLANRNADFGVRLFRSVSSRTDENVLLSPSTLSAALAALLSATDGPTREQLLQGLSLTGLDQNLPDQFQNLSAVLQAGGLRAGLAVFAGSSYPASSSYRDLVQTQFSGSVQNVDFSAPHQTADIINRWTQEQTGDRVQESVSNLDPQTQLLLASAASYQTQFRPPFNASLTQEERFYVDRYHVVMVPMMLRADKYFLAYDRSLKAGVLKLPLAGGAAMLVVFPDDDVDIGAVEDSITGEKIRAWITALRRTKLEVQLPRLLLERSFPLRDVLQTLDITQVFQDDADISNLGGAKGPKLSQVSHMSSLRVDESSDGVATGGGSFSSPAPRLTINRPFIFVCYHETSGALLLIGRVVDPTKK